ncbi:hypothetical protein BKA93DRAFT_86463 [Sparassis latifolia]
MRRKFDGGRTSTPPLPFKVFSQNFLMVGFEKSLRESNSGGGLETHQDLQRPSSLPPQMQVSYDSRYHVSSSADVSYNSPQQIATSQGGTSNVILTADPNQWKEDGHDDGQDSRSQASAANEPGEGPHVSYPQPHNQDRSARMSVNVDYPEQSATHRAEVCASSTEQWGEGAYGSVEGRYSPNRREGRNPSEQVFAARSHFQTGWSSRTPQPRSIRDGTAGPEFRGQEYHNNDHRDRGDYRGEGSRSSRYHGRRQYARYDRPPNHTMKQDFRSN